jgi:hypothetical protein
VREKVWCGNLKKGKGMSDEEVERKVALKLVLEKCILNIWTDNVQDIARRVMEGCTHIYRCIVYKINL